MYSCIILSTLFSSQGNEVILNGVIKAEQNDMKLYNYGETWRLEFDVEITSNSTEFEEIMHIEAFNEMGSLVNGIPKIELRCHPTWTNIIGRCTSLKIYIFKKIKPL